ncbi:DUF3077 domain-containing protein [Pseudomonas sp. LS1212]|uniref:DUF3077 domain-containing protein n=1 Tax=Pseudomonas sp. LS1212 TaxID=2972478 RepID=UPI00215B78ED|nr:DUF3077 domain-containing protein [Pseudomonas sp. LS1212]UVJ43858.1 DUF3077 domain-containing protein [Pseudomonas sp. LS1212]
MKKIVPDPPFTLGKTTTTPFGTCDAGHAPLFAVRDGIAAEDALIHASLLLRGVCDTTSACCQQASRLEQNGLLWSSLHSAEMAKALVDAVLDGMQV